jgi:uncharacterized spore protein YtfJ
MISTGTQPTIAGANGIHPPPETDQALRRVIDQVATNANAEVAFGTARVIGERTFIPVAQVSYGFGRRSSSGSGPATTQDAASRVISTDGFGSGVAGGLTVRPFAVIAVGPGGVRVLLLVDVQSMMARVFGCAAAALIVAAFVRRPRSQRRRFHLQIGRIDPQLWIASQAFPRPISRGILHRLAQR